MPTQEKDDPTELYVHAVMVLWNTIRIRLENVPPSNLAQMGEVLEDAGNDLLNLSDEIQTIILEQHRLES